MSKIRSWKRFPTIPDKEMQKNIHVLEIYNSKFKIELLENVWHPSANNKSGWNTKTAFGRTETNRPRIQAALCANSRGLHALIPFPQQSCSTDIYANELFHNVASAHGILSLYSIARLLWALHNQSDCQFCKVLGWSTRSFWLLSGISAINGN